MAVSEVQKSRTARLQLNAGYDSEGNSLTTPLSISGISKTASDWDNQKFMNIVGALEPCLTKTVEAIETVVTYGLSAS